MIELIEEVPRIEIVGVGERVQELMGPRLTWSIGEHQAADLRVQRPRGWERDPVAAWAQDLGSGWLQEELRGAAMVLVVAAPGDPIAGLSPMVARASRSRGAWTLGAVVLEGDLDPAARRVASTTRHALRGACNALLDTSPSWQSLSSGVDIILDMVRGDGRGFKDLERLQVTLRGRCTLGSGGPAPTLLDSARRAMAHLSRQGADASRAEGLVIAVSGPADLPPPQIAEVVHTLRQVCGGVPVAPGFVVDGGPARITLVLAGGRVVPTLA